VNWHFSVNYGKQPINFDRQTTVIGGQEGARKNGEIRARAQGGNLNVQA
jgi:hypothetical protein